MTNTLLCDVVVFYGKLRMNNTSQVEKRDSCSKRENYVLNLLLEKYYSNKTNKLFVTLLNNKSEFSPRYVNSRILEKRISTNFFLEVLRVYTTQRNATQRVATQRNARQRNATTYIHIVKISLGKKERTKARKMK